MDREKVIKGLECCMDATDKADTVICHCSDCTYKNDDIIGQRCLIELISDALELLKRKTGEWQIIWENDMASTAQCAVCARVSKMPLGKYCKWCGANMSSEYTGKFPEF